MENEKAVTICSLGNFKLKSSNQAKSECHDYFEMQCAQIELWYGMVPFQNVPINFPSVAVCSVQRGTHRDTHASSLFKIIGKHCSVVTFCRAYLHAAFEAFFGAAILELRPALKCTIHFRFPFIHAWELSFRKPKSRGWDAAMIQYRFALHQHKHSPRY